MTTETIAWYFPAACAGFGLFLIGVANLTLLGRRLPVRIVATTIAVGITLGCAFALDQPEVLVATVKLLALVLAACLLLASKRLGPKASQLLALLHRPIVRYSLLSVGGVGLAIGATLALIQAGETDADAGTAELERLNGPNSTSRFREIKVATDRGTTITLTESNRAQNIAGFTALESELIERFALDGEVIRRGPPDARSNCHGWVFTDGRLPLTEWDVALVLVENGYAEVERPRVGDLVIYSTPHTGIVRYVSEGQPVLVEGKWGTCGVFLHPADKSPYGASYKFYRSPRPGHLLVGLGGTPTPTIVDATE